VLVCIAGQAQTSARLFIYARQVSRKEFRLGLRSSTPAQPSSSCRTRSEIYRAANWLRTSLQAGEREAAFVARHCMIRPPPG
jgi:hypothetical protein